MSIVNRSKKLHIPFIYGNPVSPEKFSGRNNTITAIYGLISEGNSILLVGSPQIGKTSILKYVADQKIRKQYLAPRSKRFLFGNIDCTNLIGRPEKEFWRQASIALLEDAEDGEALMQNRERVEHENFSDEYTKEFFDSITKMKYRAILLVDEFDKFIGNINNHSGFFEIFHIITTRNPPVVFIFTSRINKKEIREIIEIIDYKAQHFIDNSVEMVVRSFDEGEAVSLINKYTRDTDILFSHEDCQYITRVADSHPYMIQAAAATLIEADKVYDKAEMLFRQRTYAHIEDVWNSLSNTSKRLLAKLALAEANGKAFGVKYDLSDLYNIRPDDYSLEQLLMRGIVEKVDRKKYVLSRKYNWRVASDGITSWVINHVIGSVQKNIEEDIKEYLLKSQKIGPITRGNIISFGRLANWLRSHVGEVIEPAKKIRSLLDLFKD